MISRIVEIEQNRFRELGYETKVTPVSVDVRTSLETLNIGNSTYILAGIMLGENDVMSDRTTVCIASATESLMMTQQQIATLDKSMNKLFKEYITIRTTEDEEYSEDKAIIPYRLDFIKITPIIK